ncbi:ATP-binding protein [Nocardioides sp. KIGAM211]|uniref:ATP-binding protein n=1 Tax=Nocardioides luti TaxID=2761101 RepID=A0A7X0RJM9_9ACTN|nr:ATP-binding protein [Nocardioides luti]MBB6628505.1 ATP-binding protein [Nocardioides luti]
MVKLDEPPVVATVEAMECVVRIECTGPGAGDLMEQVERAWTRCRVPDGLPPDITLPVSIASLAEESTIPDAGPSGEMLAEALEALTQLVTIEAITWHAGALLMLHAAALADPTNGRTVLFVGPSGMGKTTVAQRLGQQLGYVTDETAALTATRRLLRYPKPLSIIAGDGAKEQVSPDELGLVAAPDDLEIAAVVLLDRRTDALPFLEPVQSAEAVALLAEHTSHLADLPDPLRRLGALCDSVGGALRATYRDTDQLGALVVQLLGAGDPGVSS